ncbi:TonB-dependent receptor [Dyadobacter sandarakinus]|uniref:TonB-dependent receptor n=1 Tax=Dyadobacter sandarakinus TaxID=2747268 RepID=A0ABX7I812_9BACT|nr:TonB-dependent receptor [Dyadobacter sandarakinus]QRR02040.1 TonB-dependent receptor [Dyadobacter sandarakinus]
MKAFCTALLLLYAFISAAQTRVSGKVTDPKGRPVPGANIFFKGSYDGTSSDEDGSFTLVTDLAGAQLLTVQALGFEVRETRVMCGGQPVVLTFILTESISMLHAVTITAGAMEASDEKKSVVLKPLDIVTTSGAIGDITAALLTLPGTSTVGNDGRLFVRGGDASETAIYIDGLLAGNAFGSTIANVPTRTRFSPNLFKGSYFSTGGYSAEYGQALSSALALSTIDLPLRNQGDLSIMSVGGGYTHTLTGARRALTASANYYNLAPYQSVVRQHFDWEQSPVNWDSEISFRQKWGNASRSRAGILKVYYHTEGNRMTIWQKIPGEEGRGDRTGMHNRYNYGNVSFRQTAGRGWTLYGGGAFSRNHDAYALNDLKVRQVNQLGHAKLVTIKDFSPRLSIKNGLEGFIRAYSERLVNEQRQRAYTDRQVHHFTEATYYFSNHLVIAGGLRGGYSSLARQYWLTPRLSLAYSLHEAGQLSLAAGAFRQLPEEKLRIAATNLGNTAARHYILNYFLIKNSRTFRAEAFYKIYDKLVTFEGTSAAPQNLRLSGFGYARGADFFFRDKKTWKNTDYWVTYSYIDSKRRFASYQSPVRPSFAPRHNGSVVVKRFVPRLKSQLGASWSWNSGYPYSNPNLAGEMQQTTKAYSDLSLSWSYLPRPNVIVHLACSNVLGRTNIFGYRYAAAPDTDGTYASLPVGQGASRFAFAAIFITFSKDKNANQLNNL